MIRRDLSRNHKQIKNGIWLYFFLLIFEGAIRKWVLPSYSDFILIIRDPVACFIIYKSIQLGIFQKIRLISSFLILGFILFISALLFGHGNLIVGLYGLRPYIIHFPVMFIIGKVFSKKDVLNVGKTMLVLSIFMIVLTIIQFYSMQSSWINRGIGGDVDGAGFGGALGYFRPPGTFSFINGLTLFFGLSTAFTFYFLHNSEKINKLLLTLSILAVLLSIPFTISRTVFFQTILALIFFIIIAPLRRSLSFKRLLVLFLVICISYSAFVFGAVNVGVEAFVERYVSANQSEGGLKGTLIDRMFLTLWDAIFSISDSSFFGKGIGANTNVGLKVFNKSLDERISDYEWFRIVDEFGSLLGIIFILMRVQLFVSSFQIVIRQLKNREVLSWMIFSFAGIQILQGQIAQPTSLGFIVLAFGLIEASQNTETISKQFNISQ